MRADAPQTPRAPRISRDVDREDIEFVSHLDKLHGGGIARVEFQGIDLAPVQDEIHPGERKGDSAILVLRPMSTASHSLTAGGDRLSEVPSHEGSMRHLESVCFGKYLNNGVSGRAYLH